ncbi:hypothetical protein M0812_08804 [Anaeramoeba flamelloides]|uniref:Uncharacterized protein n=1 Tax=Anaeramoeba flamelloides TaxID=1746091 RepID=A0AAV8A0L9_9EUKA|nr:hypothetical protein M0812_08804 [Anaeramoeba flamelloides]
MSSETKKNEQEQNRLNQPEDYKKIEEEKTDIGIEDEIEGINQQIETILLQIKIKEAENEIYTEEKLRDQILLDQFQKKCKGCKAEIKKIKKTISFIRKKNEMLDGNIKKLIQQEEEHQIEKFNLEKETQIIQNDLDKAQQRTKKLCQMEELLLLQIESYQRKIIDTKNELLTIPREKKQLEQTTTVLQSQLTKITKNLNLLKTNYQKLNNQVEKMKEAKNKLAPKKTTLPQLFQKEDQIKNNGNTYPPPIDKIQDNYQDNFFLLYLNKKNEKGYGEEDPKKNQAQENCFDKDNSNETRQFCGTNVDTDIIVETKIEKEKKKKEEKENKENKEKDKEEKEKEHQIRVHNSNKQMGLEKSSETNDNED